MRVEDADQSKSCEQAFAPEALEVVNDSHRHAGHGGSPGTGESHFTIKVVSPASPASRASSVIAWSIRFWPRSSPARSTRSPSPRSRRRNARLVLRQLDASARSVASLRHCSLPVHGQMTSLANRRRPPRASPMRKTATPSSIAITCLLAAVVVATTAT